MRLPLPCCGLLALALLIAACGDDESASRSTGALDADAVVRVAVYPTTPDDLDPLAGHIADTMVDLRSLGFHVFSVDPNDVGIEVDFVARTTDQDVLSALSTLNLSGLIGCAVRLSGDVASADVPPRPSDEDCLNI